MKNKFSWFHLSDLHFRVDDAYMGGKSRDGKRGRGASGKTPFIAAVTTTEEGHPIALEFNVISGFTNHKKGI